MRQSNLENNQQKCFYLGDPLIYHLKIFNDDENVYFVDTSDIFPETDAYDSYGNYRWSITHPKIEYLSGSDKNYVYAFLYNHSLAAINKYTGKVVWIIPDVQFTYQLSLYSDAIYVVNDYGSLLKISKKDGKVLWIKDINVSCNIIKYGNYVLAYNDVFLYLIRSADSRIVWKISMEDLGLNGGDWHINLVTADDDRISLAILNFDTWKGALFILGWSYATAVIVVVITIFLIMEAIGIVLWKKRMKK